MILIQFKGGEKAKKKEAKNNKSDVSGKSATEKEKDSDKDD